MVVTRDCLVIRHRPHLREIVGPFRNVALPLSALAEVAAQRLHIPVEEISILESVIPRIPEPAATDDTDVLHRQYVAYKMLDDVDEDVDLRAFFGIAMRLVNRGVLPLHEARIILRYMEREDHFDARWTGEREDEPDYDDCDAEAVNEDGEEGGAPY